MANATQWGYSVVTETITSDSQINTRVNCEEIIDEIVWVLRKTLTDRQSRTETDTDSFTGDGATTIFEFTNDLDSESRHKVMDVTLVTIDGTEQTAYEDYVIGYRKESPILGKIQFWNAPDDDAAIVVYYEHTYHWVYSEYPRIDLPTNRYPVVSVNTKETIIEQAGVGGKAYKVEVPIIISIVDMKRNFVENTMRELITFFSEKTNREGFFNFRYIEVTRLTAVVPAEEDSNDTVYGQQMILSIPYEYEFSK